MGGRFLGGVVALLLLCACATTSAGPRLTISSPLADTATRGYLVWDVANQDYVAEEYLVSGQADTYEPVAMADAADMGTRNNVTDLHPQSFTRAPIAHDRPYTTRIIVYRPRDAARFSGNVIVETLHPNGGGVGAVWRLLNAYFIEHGDIYVAVQHPVTFAGVRAADEARYGSLAAESATQLWGMLADVGGLIRSSAANNPLHGYAIRAMVLTGYSYTGVATATFADFHHDAARQANGRPIFDGYVPMANAMLVRPLDVPVMRINTQSDFDSFGGLANRGEDGDRYRLYEVAGAPHAGQPPRAPTRYDARPPRPVAAPDVRGAPRATGGGCAASYPAGAIGNDFPLQLVGSAAFDNMFRWIRDGIAPPRAPWIETEANGALRRDARANALGGVRYPSVGVPAAAYGVGTGECFLFGYRVPFDAATMRTLYGNRATYLARVEAEAQRLVRERWLRAEDVPVLMEQARTTAPEF